MDNDGYSGQPAFKLFLHPFSWLDHDDHGDPPQPQPPSGTSPAGLKSAGRLPVGGCSCRTCSLPGEVNNAPTQHRTTNLGTNSREFAISAISSVTYARKSQKYLSQKSNRKERERERQSVPARLSRGTSNRSYTVLDCSHCSHFMTAWLHPIEIFHPNVYELKNFPRILTSLPGHILSHITGLRPMTASM